MRNLLISSRNPASPPRAPALPLPRHHAELARNPRRSGRLQDVHRAAALRHGHAIAWLRAVGRCFSAGWPVPADKLGRNRHLQRLHPGARRYENRADPIGGEFHLCRILLSCGWPGHWSRRMADGDELEPPVRARNRDGTLKDLTPGEKTRAYLLGWDQSGETFYVATSTRGIRARPTMSTPIRRPTTAAGLHLPE